MLEVPEKLEKSLRNFLHLTAIRHEARRGSSQHPINMHSYRPGKVKDRRLP